MGSSSQHCSSGGLREEKHAAGNTAQRDHQSCDIRQGSFGVKHGVLDHSSKHGRHAGWKKAAFTCPLQTRVSFPTCYNH